VNQGYRLLPRSKENGDFQLNLTVQLVMLSNRETMSERLVPDVRTASPLERTKKWIRGAQKRNRAG